MKKIISGKLLLFLFALTNAIYGIMIFWSLRKLLEFTGGSPVFDMRPGGYTFAEAKVLLESLGTEGIIFYKNIQLRLDLFYPLGFIVTYSIGCIWVFNKIGKWRVTGYVGAVFATLAGLSDYVENIFIGKMLSSFPQVSTELVASSNNATLVKSISTTVAMIIFLLGFLILRIFKLRNRAFK